MRVFRTIADVDLPWASPIGFVPTMGAFHAGHLELMRQAKEECGYCVVSLFVNPTQFGAGEDFEKYPRDEAKDLEMARSVGVDAVFAPEAGEMYRDSQTLVSVSGVADRWDGAHRPGHFAGVATIVAKLLNIVRPTIVYFGLKDFQQCAVIRRMALDLNFPIALAFVETVREPDGLAMSSRNAYLSPVERAQAPLLYETLAQCASNIRGGAQAAKALADGTVILEDSGFSVQYLALVAEDDLSPLLVNQPGARIIAAVLLGKTRLIDNIEVNRT